jgi:cadmium resistance protein CadD (predicted permease)
MSLTLLALGTVAFAATNIDGLLVLLAFFADPRFTPGEIVAGQYLGISALIAASFLIALWSLVIPAPYLGLMGFLPLGIGLRRLGAADGSIEPVQSSARRSNPLTVAAVTVANGGDNIGTYAPFFSTIGICERGILILLFWLLTAVWCGAAYVLVQHSKIGAPIRVAGGRALPVVLIALGIYIIVRMNVPSLLLH